MPKYGLKNLIIHDLKYSGKLKKLIMILKDKIYKAFNPVVWRKSISFMVNEIAVNLSQEKINFINEC